MTEKILVIGSGFLGDCIVKLGIQKNFDIVGAHFTTEPFVNICELQSIEKIIEKFSPKTIINCAALTDVDKIEKFPKLAYEINSNGVKNLITVCSSKKIRLIHIYTDSVFDGKTGNYSEDDVPNPINEYGKTKFFGEQFLYPYLKNNTIIRTNFYGTHSEKKFLLEWILNNLKNNNRISGFDDVFFNPLEKTNLSEMILEIVEKEINGIIHLSSNKILSKFQFAKTIANFLDFPLSLVEQSNIGNSSLLANRPKNTTLNNKKMKQFLQTKPLELEDWLVSNYELLKND